MLKRLSDFLGFPAVAAALGAGLVLARQITWGVGLGPDGINYVAIARNLLAGQGFTDFDGGVSTLWPPLWPLLLAASGLGILDPIRVAGPLNAAFFALTVLVLGRYLERRLESRFVARWATLAFALSAPLAEVSRQAMSEPAFLLFTTLALVAADRFFERGVDSGAGGNRGRSLLLRAALWSALAWLTRYLGVALVASVGLLLLLRRRGTTPPRTRWADAGLYTAIAAAPMALWLFRNLRSTGSPTGHTRAVEYSWTGLLADWGRGLAEFAAFDHGAWFLPAAALSLAFAWFLHRRAPESRPAPLPETDPEAGPPRPPGPIPVFGVFAAVYLAALAFALMAGQTWHGVAARFLAPLSVPLLVLAAAAFDRLSGAPARRRPAPDPADGETGRETGPGTGGAPFARALRSGLAPAPGLLLAGGLVFHLLGQALPNARAIARANSGEAAPGAGYRGGPWAESETLRALREGPLPARLYSNLPLLAYLETDGRTEVRYLPADLSPVVKRLGGAPTTPAERLARGLSGMEDGARIVWHREFGTAEYRHGSPPAFRVRPSLRLVGEFPDGVIRELARGGEEAPGAEPGPNPYRAAYAAIAAGEFGEPVARTAFALYQRGRTLALLREPCSPEDLAAGFFLHLHPAAPDSLPEARREIGFENRDFQFFEHGVILDRRAEGSSGEGAESPKCLALVPLPSPDFDRILVGQIGPGPSDGLSDGLSGGLSDGLSGGPSGGAPAPLWEAIVRGDRDRYRAAYDAIVSGEMGEPAARAGFDLYFDPDPDPDPEPDREGRALIYFEPSCSRADRELKFFLHLHPAEPDALPPERRVYGFENRDFDFREYGLTVPAEVAGAEHCLAIVPLPPGDFPRIATGQWRAGEAPVWSAALGAGAPARVSTPGGWPGLHESLVAGERGDPVARSFFDLYLDEAGLTYLRAPCTEEDTTARFFFHLYPEDREALPEDRRQYGFENRDFDFADRGVILPPDHDPRLGPESAGAKCLARAPLPDYDLLRLRTGQWAREEGGLWTVEWAPGGQRVE